MDYKKIIDNQRNYFRDLSNKFLKEDFRYVTNKSNFNEKRVGVFSRAYYKRKKLVQIGTLTYGYVFRIRDNQSKSNPISTWVVFSPEVFFEKNPAEFEYIAQNLNKITSTQKPEKRHRKLKIMVTEPYAEPKYFKVPLELSNNHIVYISHVYYWRDKNPNLKLGMIPIFISENITKEIIYLPERYWIDEMKSI